ncbi:bifunctional DedA family/phosphatase PAP2 family protein [Paenibacillus sp. y28]|uniref:bifunctional DedA family/phosphatase PAP2 family protein n=1 Tax=Paenibacillus sp. y28 TaxID=3129110 RepID=UPI00301A4932
MEHVLAHWVLHYGYWGIFGALALGVVGLPLPDEVLLTFVGFTIYKGTFSFSAALLSTFLGTAAGITLSYGIGNKLGLPFLHKFGPKLHLSEQKITRSQQLFTKYGSWLLVVGYFVPGLRHLTAYMAGMLRLPLQKFAVSAYSGALLWNFAFVSLGYGLGEKWVLVRNAVHHDSLYFLGAAVLLILALYIMNKRKGTDRFMQLSTRSTSVKKVTLLSILILLLFLSGFAKFVMVLLDKQLFTFDPAVISAVQGQINPQLTFIMKAVTFIGSTMGITIWTILSVLLMIWQRKRWEALFLIVAMGGCAGFNQLLKNIFQRERPTLHRLIEETGYSFPSGHSMGAIVFFGMICMLLVMFLRSPIAKAVIVFVSICFILGIGISRVYLGVHYPSDIIAGYCAGGAWLTICYLFLRLILARRGRSF